MERKEETAKDRSSFKVPISLRIACVVCSLCVLASSKQAKNSLRDVEKLSPAYIAARESGCYG